MGHVLSQGKLAMVYEAYAKPNMWCVRAHPQRVELALSVPELSRAGRALLQELPQRVIERKISLSEQQTGLWAHYELSGSHNHTLGLSFNGWFLSVPRSQKTITYQTLKRISTFTLLSHSNLLIMLRSTVQLKTLPEIVHDLAGNRNDGAAGLPGCTSKPALLHFEGVPG